MKCVLVSPTRLDVIFEKEDPLEVQKFLSYKNKSISYELSRLDSNYEWVVRKVGVQGYHEQRNFLLAEEIKTLLFKDHRTYWTYVGMLPRLQEKYSVKLYGEIDFPLKKTLLWNQKPIHSLRPFQQEAIETLLTAKQGGVEIATGLGKTLIALHIVKQLGLSTVILTPSLSIAEQFYRQFLECFGSRYVGGYFGKFKNGKKLITVTVAQSLRKIDSSHSSFSKFSTKKILIADESHMYATKTLAQLCFGLFKNIPYRFFFSATQMRNDGTDLLLESITGKILMNMDVQQGVELGFLAKPEFYLFQIPSERWFDSKDPNELTREHLYYNPLVNQKAVQCAERFLSQGKSVLILIDEIKQFQKLYSSLRHHKPLFAYGSTYNEALTYLPKEYSQSNTTELVAQFNAGHRKLLIGTSCISQGTDLPAVNAIIYLQGNKSEIMVKQAVGRGTRKTEGKDSFHYIDFDVYTNPLTHQHALERKRIYESIYGTVNQIPWEPRK